jgi:hypothetical protein
MNRLILAAGLAALCSGVAFADARKDPSISVTSGVYEWNHETVVSGVPIKERNRECLIPEKTSITLSRLASDLDKTCTVDKVAPTQGGYTFKLTCGGRFPGSADATLKGTPTTLAITAKGMARVGGVPSDMTITATATRMGDCSAEQLAEGRAKLAAEKAKAG